MGTSVITICYLCHFLTLFFMAWRWWVCGGVCVGVLADDISHTETISGIQKTKCCRNIVLVYVFHGFYFHPAPPPRTITPHKPVNLTWVWYLQRGIHKYWKVPKKIYVGYYVDPYIPAAFGKSNTFMVLRDNEALHMLPHSSHPSTLSIVAEYIVGYVSSLATRPRSPIHLYSNFSW